jgi:ribosomal protein L16/L10AE
MTGKATRGTVVNYGDYGLVALEPAWISSNQIEAARIAMTRYIKRGGQVWIKIFPDKPITEKPPRPAWVPVKVHPNTGLQSLSPAVLCSRSAELLRTRPVKQ